MISCYEGVLGGGKSYHAVKHCLEYLARGGNIYSNIPLVWPQVRRYCRRSFGFIPKPSQYHSLTLEELSRLDKVVVGGTSDCPSLLVVDEIHLYFNSRDWANTSRSFLAWLTQSRKLHCDCIFITQNHLNMDKQFTRLLGRYWHFRDLRQWKLPGLGIRWPLNQFFSAEIDQDGKTVLHSQFEPIDKDVFKCYSSDQLFDGHKDFAGRGLARVSLERFRSSPLRLRYKRFCRFLKYRLFWRKIRMISRVKLVLFLAVVSFAIVSVFRSCRSGGGLFSSKKADSSVSESVSVAPVSLPVASAPPQPSKSVCSSWGTRGGSIWGFSDGLLFEGFPDGWQGGCPVYFTNRGFPL